MGSRGDTNGHSLPAVEREGIELYRAAIEREGLTFEEAAELLGDAKPGQITTRIALNRLVALKLLHPPSPGEDLRFQPVNPASAEVALVETLLRDAYETVAQIGHFRTELALAARAYREQRSVGEDAITVHTGLSAINNAIREAATECTTELLTLQPGGGRSREVLKSTLPATLSLLDRQVRMRTIYQHAARSSPETREFVRIIQEKKAHVRTLDESFERLIIFDRAVAFIPGQQDRRTALEIRFPGMVEFLAGLFDREWLRAKPFTAPDRSLTTSQISDELGLAILRHVVAGDTDAVTAQKLGISVRRCQEYISKLAAKLGSRSRAHLGFLVAQLGILDGEDRPADE